ncbi:MAG: alpha-ribazole phosphatase [Lysobacteraceae bacterium]|nr:MAG: alpha-ribazole phosphatase [Xanthomonadaceae bacterium]
MSPIVAVRPPPLPGTRGVCYGQTDWPPDLEAIAATVPRLRAELPEWPILSSPLQRCLRLASRVLTPRHGALAVDDRLMEMDHGDWEGRCWTDLDPTLLRAWSRDVVGFRPPGGECFADLIERVGAVVDGLTGPTIFVTHAGVIRALWHLVAGWPARQAAVEPVPHGLPIPIRRPRQRARRA